MKNTEKQEMIQGELDLENTENIEQKQDDVEVTESHPEGSTLALMEELRGLINQAVLEAFKPFEMLLAEMKKVTDEIEETKEELEGTKEILDQSIETQEETNKMQLIEILADRGINQIDDSKIDKSFLSDREKMRLEYKNNPHSFLKNIK